MQKSTYHDDDKSSYHVVEDDDGARYFLRWSEEYGWSISKTTHTYQNISVHWDAEDLDLL